MPRVENACLQCFANVGLSRKGKKCRGQKEEIAGRRFNHKMDDVGRNAYLMGVLTRLPTMTNHQIPEVTPAAWAKARLQLQRQAAS
jgi:hypothetical protein